MLVVSNVRFDPKMTLEILDVKKAYLIHYI